MSRLMVFRKSAVKAPKLSATKVAAAIAEIGSKVRVERDEFVTFMLGGGFAKLEVVSQSAIDSDMQRPKIMGKGWEVPADSLGRVGVATPSSRESIRLWAKQQLPAYGINPDAVAIILVED